jgi:serine/threonine protein phosphatase PrpC
LNKFFDRLFRKNDKQNGIIQLEKPTHEDDGIKYGPPQLLVGSAQSVGMQRDHNEDTLFTMSSVIADGNSQLPFGIFIVADGMGGHQHGEVASGTATRALVEYLSEKLIPPLLGLRAEEQIESLQEILETGIEEAQKLVIRKAPGGGTTLTTALVIGNKVTLAHVGDSRAYFIYKDGHIEAMTRDHSLVNRLVELGQITEEEAAVHPQRNVLYRAVGQLDPFSPDINTFPFPEEGSLLLCSDGLWGVISEEQILDIVCSLADLPDICRRLVQAANDNGGPDNISVVMVKNLTKDRL